MRVLRAIEAQREPGERHVELAGKRSDVVEPQHRQPLRELDARAPARCEHARLRLQLQLGADVDKLRLAQRPAQRCQAQAPRRYRDASGVHAEPAGKRLQRRAHVARRRDSLEIGLLRPIEAQRQALERDFDLAGHRLDHFQRQPRRQPRKPLREVERCAGGRRRESRGIGQLDLRVSVVRLKRRRGRSPCRLESHAG